MRLLKKYPNRRIYDTEESRFITLSDVREMVLSHEDFQVVDSKTGNDLTRTTLLQIIADLDLPRHGFELLPLDGTLTPMPNGDHLMRWHDAGETRLELMRHSAADAESYEHFAMLMYHLGKAVRPMLSTTPADPTLPTARRAAPPRTSPARGARGCSAIRCTRA